MTNEAMKAMIASIRTFDDAYNMACESGYKGTFADFAALVEKAADEIMPMDLHAMDNVAGGSLSNSWDAVKQACSSASAWMQANRALMMDVSENLGVIIGTSAFAYTKLKHDAELRARDAGNTPVNLDITYNNSISFKHNDTLFVFDDYETWMH